MEVNRMQAMVTMVNELQVQKAGLEGQIEELRRAQAQLEKSRDNYADLYDFAPVGYSTFNSQALIAGVNLTGAVLLVIDSPELLKCDFRQFVTPGDANRWDSHISSILQQTGSQSCDLLLRRRDGSNFCGRLDSICRETGNGTGVVRTAVSDITAQKEAEEALRAGETRYREALQHNIVATSKFHEARDPYTARHEHRVTELACAIAAAMGFPAEQIEVMRLSSYIHDSGKLAVPLEILIYRTQLNEMQMGMIRSHPQIAYDILADMDLLWPLALTIWQHQERLDGSGYPQQLRSGDIIPEARILAVADVFEAMSSSRPYLLAPGVYKALEEISGNSGKLYDPVATDTCLKLIKEKGSNSRNPVCRLLLIKYIVAGILTYRSSALSITPLSF